jgi:sugar lactone lactonase YvrE
MTIESAVRTHSSRLRVRLLCASVAALLCACGPGGPKRETDDGSGGSGGDSGPSTGISVLAGDPVTGGSANNKGTSARFNTPRGLAVDTNGNVYVADEGNLTIRKIAPDGTVTTLAGLAGASGTTDNKGNRARFTQPTAVTIDGNGDLYVMDGTAIRKITADGTVTTVTRLSFGNFGMDVQNTPAGIAADGDGNLYVTSGIDTRRVPISNPNRTTTLETGAVFPVYGTGVMVPRGVVVDPDGTAYVADLTRTLSRATSGATALTSFVGSHNQAGNADGNASTARFQQLVALTIDKNGNLYGADAINNTIRKITTPDGTVTTPAGTSKSTTLRTGKLPGSFAQLRGIAVDGSGNLYATSGNAVVKIVLP